MFQSFTNSEQDELEVYSTREGADKRAQEYEDGICEEWMEWHRTRDEYVFPSAGRSIPMSVFVNKKQDDFKDKITFHINGLDEDGFVAVMKHAKLLMSIKNGTQVDKKEVAVFLIPRNKEDSTYCEVSEQSVIL